MTILLRDGYLGEISYGFMRDDAWVLAVRYVTPGSEALADKTPGAGFSRAGRGAGNFFFSFALQ